MLYTVQNESRHPRVVYAGGRGVLVPMGQGKTIEMTDAEAENAKAPGVHVALVGAAPVAAPVPPAPPPAEDPAEPEASVLQVDLTGAGGDQGIAILAVLAMKDGPFLAFKSAATKILGPGAPSTKAELIAALEEKAKA